MPRSLPPSRRTTAALLLALGLSVLACTGEVSVDGPSPAPSPVPSPGPSPHPVEPGDFPKTAGSFETAKKWLYEDVTYDHRKSLYCGCSFDEDKNVDLEGCGMGELASKSRAKRVEAEHVMPAARIGGHLPCWKEPLCKRSNGQTYKGRECCEDSEPWFEAAHNDLNNLFPAIGQLNNDRQDYPYGEVAGEPRAYGRCDFEVDRATDVAEPAPSVRGEIARAWLYMEDTYGLTLSAQERAQYQKWNAEDPPETWERERNARIEKIQGRGNRFVE